MSKKSSVIGIPDYSRAQNLGTPSLTTPELTEISYTMPDDGWFFYRSVGSNLIWDKPAVLKVNGKLLVSSQITGENSLVDLDGILPVKKGDIVTLSGIHYHINKFINGVHVSWSAFFIPNRTR